MQPLFYQSSPLQQHQQPHQVLAHHPHMQPAAQSPYAGSPLPVQRFAATHAPQLRRQSSQPAALRASGPAVLPPLSPAPLPLARQPPVQLAAQSMSQPTVPYYAPPQQQQQALPQQFHVAQPTLYGSTGHRPIQPQQSAATSVSLPTTPQPVRQAFYQQPQQLYQPASPQPVRETYLVQQQPQPQLQSLRESYQVQQLPQQQPQQPQPHFYGMQRHASSAALLQPNAVAAAASPLASPQMPVFDPFECPPIVQASPQSPSVARSPLPTRQQPVPQPLHQHPHPQHQQAPGSPSPQRPPQLAHQHSMPLLNHLLQHQLHLNAAAQQQQQSHHVPQAFATPQPAAPSYAGYEQRVSRSEPSTPLLARANASAAQQQPAQPAVGTPQLQRRGDGYAVAGGAGSETVLSVLTPGGEAPPQGAADGQNFGPNDEFGPAVPRGAATRAGRRLKRRVTRGLAATFSVLAQLDEAEPAADGDEGASEATKVRYMDGRADEESAAMMAAKAGSPMVPRQQMRLHYDDDHEEDESSSEREEGRLVSHPGHDLENSTDLLDALSRQSSDDF